MRKQLSPCHRGWHPVRALAALMLLCAMCLPARAQGLTVATLSPELTRDGPGLLLRDILGGQDAQVAAAAGLIADRAPDVLLLTGFDWDMTGAALAAFGDVLAARGVPYPHTLAPRPNSGLMTALDLDGDGRTGGPGDAQGWGRFAGAGGLALLSRLPLDRARLVDFTALGWRDLPGARLPRRPDGGPFPSAAAQAVQRLSSTGHWAVPVRTGADVLWLAAYGATPPVFDGPEDRNGLRNAEENRLWRLWLDGALSVPPPATPVVILGRGNLDPVDGDGLHGEMSALLSHPRLQDPRPAGPARAQQPGQRGSPATDTARYAPPPDGPGSLRVDYVIPDAALQVLDSGIDWSPALRHGLVWVTLRLPG